MKVIWIMATPREPATGVAKTVLLAGGGRDKPYYRDGQHYRAGVASEPRFTASLAFGENGWTGGAVPTTGHIVFKPAQKTLLDELAALYWLDAPITVETGPEAGPWPRLLTGTVASASVADHGLVLEIADLSAALNKPLITARFAGTGGAEGGTEAEGRVKRRSWGRVFNIEGRILDKANNIYEFGDPAFPWQQWEALRDKGREGPFTGIAWQGSVDATLTALKASEPAQGGGVVAPSIACAKWWTQPAGPLTADIFGELGTGYVETAPEIAARIVAAASGPAIVNSAAMAALRAGAAGLHIGDDEETTAQALDRLLAGVSLLWVLEPAGMIRLREWSFSNPTETLVSRSVSRQRVFAPIKQRRVGYQKSHRLHNDGEIAAVLQALDVSYSDGTPIEDLKPAMPGATKGAPPGTNVGNTPVETVEGAVGAVNDPNTGLAAQGQTLDQVLIDVSELQATYGDTASASASAAAAETARLDAERQALVAAQHAAGNLVRKSTFSDGTKGGWGGALQADPGPFGDSVYVLKNTSNDLVESPFITGDWGGKTIRMRGWVKRPAGTSSVGVGVWVQGAAVSYSHTVIDAQAVADTWSPFEADILVPADTTGLRPFVRCNSPFGVLWDRLHWRDVTESKAAAASALAASTDASAAVTARAEAVEAKNDAAASASAASSSSISASVSATSALMVEGNQHMDGGPDGWAQTPANADALVPATHMLVHPSYAGATNVLRTQTGQRGDLYSWKKYPIRAGRTYRLRARFGVSDPALGTIRQYMGIQQYGASGTVGTNVGLRYYVTGGGLYGPGWHEVEGSFNADSLETDATSVRLVALNNYDAKAGADVALDYFTIEDVTGEVKAASSASIAESASVSASSSAASAQTSAQLAASVGTGAMNPDPAFSEFSSVNAPPDRWQTNISSAGTTVHWRISKMSGVGYGWRQVAQPGAQVYSGQEVSVPIREGGYYVMEADVRHNGGVFIGSGIWFRPYTSGGSFQDHILNFYTDPDETGVAAGIGTVGRLYRFRKLVKVTLANATKFHIYAAAHWSTIGSISNLADHVFEHIAVRPATQEEIAAGVALPQLQATVSTHAGAITTLQGRSLAYLQQTVNAGAGATAFAELRAETSPGNVTSSVAFGAREIHAWNPAGAGLWKKALSVVGGNVTVYGDLTVGGSILVGNFRARIGIEPITMSVYDGQVINYGANLGSVPEITPDFSGFPALAAGEAYVFRMDSHTPSGGIARVKKTGTGTVATQTTAAGTAGSGGPTLVTHKPTVADAYNGRYTFRVTGNMRREEQVLAEPPMTVYYGHIEFQTWFKPSSTGVWTKGPVFTIFASDTPGPTATIAYNQARTVEFGTAIGQHSTQEFGISIKSSGYPAYDTLSGLTNVQYATTSATETTATPGNSPLLPIVVRPKNA